MKKEDFVSTLVMTTVSILMLVGVTIAWYTKVYAHPTVTGMSAVAEEQGSIKIALEPEGEDISELIGDDKYVKIGLEELLNIENNQMAPGAYGEVVFYITSLNQDITSCQLAPSLVPGYESEFEEGYINGVPEDATVTINYVEKNIRDVLEEHFDFYYYDDEDSTVMVSADTPMPIDLEWDDENNAGIEKKVTIYWKWHYEDPAATAIDSTMTESEKESAIYDYDMEDTWIGTHLDTMSVHFDFLIQ